MPDYGKISWQSTKRLNAHALKSTTVNPSEAILNLCKKHIPEKTILNSSTALTEERAALHEAHRKIVKKIAEHPFLVIFVLWTQEIASLHPEMVHAAKVLLEQGFIGIADKKGQIWTIEDAHGFDHRVVLNAIRCQPEMPLETREQLVSAYISFMQWLSQETHGYFNNLEDPDVISTRGRVLAHPLFINFLNALNAKEQLVAKLLYFGGSRTLDEVLNLQLDAIDLEKHIIHFESQQVHYPTHVFADIQAIAGKKKQGRLFLGRQNAPLSPPTIFRNFKKAALQVGLGQTFAPAVLTSGS